MEKKHQTSVLKGFLLACFVGLTLLSCTSIDKSDLSAEPMSVALTQPSGNVSTIHLVPRYVFLDRDKHSLIVKEDTVGPQYHLALTAENAKSCHDLIDIAYLNDMEVEFKYDKSNNEVNSVKLLGWKAGTRGHTPIFTTEWVQALKTNMPTYTCRSLTLLGYKWSDSTKKKLLILQEYPLPLYLNAHIPNFAQCLRLVEYAEANNLKVEMVVVGDTDEIVSIRLCGAVRQTFWKTIRQRHSRVGLAKECSTLSEEELKQVYRRIIENSCDNKQRPDRYPCIPFGYAKDGCFARAHAMRRLINMMGFECRK